MNTHTKEQQVLILATKAKSVDDFTAVYQMLLDKWPAPVTTDSAVDECNAMLAMSTEDFGKAIIAMPPVFSENVFPVAVMRLIVRDMRIQTGAHLRAGGCKPYDRLANLYFPIIEQATADPCIY